jgi:hypothetical protein
MDKPITQAIIEFSRPLTESEQNDFAQALRMWLEELTISVDGEEPFTRWRYE